MNDPAKNGGHFQWAMSYTEYEDPYQIMETAIPEALEAADAAYGDDDYGWSGSAMVTRLATVTKDGVPTGDPKVGLVLFMFVPDGYRGE